MCVCVCVYVLIQDNKLHNDKLHKILSRLSENTVYPPSSSCFNNCKYFATLSRLFHSLVAMI